MGLDEERFVDLVTDEFRCLICSEVLQDPIECSGCQTNFCTACITAWQVRSQECPNRCKLSLQPCHRGFKNLLLRLKLKCIYATKGCDTVVTIESMLKHEGSECLFRDIQCGNCSEKLLAKDLSQHLEVCPMVQLSCAQCKISFLRRDAEDHDCLKSLVAAYREMEQGHEELKADIAELSRSLPVKVQPTAEENQQLHYNVMCTGCRQEPIQGVRFMCRKCISYDLCELCIRKILHGHNDYWQIPMGLDHEGITCDGCRTRPIVGPRYKCKRCVDFDFCHACKISAKHEHNDFEGFLPYWVAAVPLAEHQTTYHVGDVLTRSWMLINLGPEVLRDPIISLYRGDSCCAETSAMFHCELATYGTFVLTFSGVVIQQTPGTYTSEWKLSTAARVSYFGPILSYRLIVL